MSEKKETLLTRRTLLTWGATLASAGAVTTALTACKKQSSSTSAKGGSGIPFKWDGEPPPKGMTVADPNKGAGKALAYYVKASEVDPKKEKLFKPNRDCANCTFYQSVPGTKAWGRCTMLAMSLVTAEGWCKVWNGKPGAKK